MFQAAPRLIKGESRGDRGTVGRADVATGLAAIALEQDDGIAFRNALELVRCINGRGEYPEYTTDRPAPDAKVAAWENTANVFGQIPKIGEYCPEIDLATR